MFWGNSPHSKTIFETQKRIVRIIMKVKARDSCREMFCTLGILTLYSQYIYSTLMFVVKHKDICTLNVELHNLNTRHRFDLHIPSVTVTKVQKGAYYSGITLFNYIPSSVKRIAGDTNKFKHALKMYLMEKYSYSVEEYIVNDTN